MCVYWGCFIKSTHFVYTHHPLDDLQSCIYGLHILLIIFTAADIHSKDVGLDESPIKQQGRPPFTDDDANPSAVQLRNENDESQQKLTGAESISAGKQQYGEEGSSLPVTPLIVRVRTLPIVESPRCLMIVPVATPNSPAVAACSSKPVPESLPSFIATADTREILELAPKTSEETSAGPNPLEDYVSKPLFIASPLQFFPASPLV